MATKAVEIKGLDFSYPDGSRALRGVNLDIYEGESVGIIGPNGAGKTTFLLHLNGLLSGAGTVLINGRELNKENLKAVRKEVGLVFQDPDDQLFMPTVFEDVAFGPLNMGSPKDKIKESVVKALKAVDMLDSEKRISHHLSFGEKKRIAIATVLSMGPDILVLDEPSSNLDPRHRRELIDLLKRFDITKIIATHDLDLVRTACLRVVLLEKGRIAADGKAADILDDKKLLTAHSLM